MDAWEAAKVVFDRVRALDPGSASRITGLLLVQDASDEDLIRLAFAPDRILRAFVAAAKPKTASPPPWGGGAEREMAVVQAKALAAARAQLQLVPSAFPFEFSPHKADVNLNFLLQHHQQQQQSEPQRAVGGDMHRFPARSPRMDRGDLMSSSSPAARQIYLTFPADSTFSEEDVSNYFSSMYGPVQDVRIPYQHKRMFGFVTFAYADTVRAILGKGNPHFVCDARVLVKPYREKAKVVPDRTKLQQHPHHGGDFAGGTSPTGLLDPSRDPFDLQQPQIGARMVYGSIASHEALFLRRKLEEQQQAAELQQAIELESRRFTRLQLLDLKSRGHRLGSPVGRLGQAADGKGNGGVFLIHAEDVSFQVDNKMNSGSLAMSASALAAAAAGAEGGHEEQQQQQWRRDGDGCPMQAMVNHGEEEKRESGPVTATHNVACRFQESSVVEHILPDSPFASPTKASTEAAAAAARNGHISNGSPHHVAASLFPPASSIELPPYSSCFFQAPRFSPGHEAIGL